MARGDERGFTRIGLTGAQRQGRGGRGSGQKRKDNTFDPSGFCVCMNCGHRELHERGVPCVKKKCPQCGTVLTRE
jgi:hypothetical protein